MPNYIEKKSAFTKWAIVPLFFLLAAILLLLPILLKKRNVLFFNTLPTSQVPDTQTACDESLCPANILDLTYWKLTLPIGTEKKSSRPLEILQPELTTYKFHPWFTTTPDTKGVIFRAPINAPTTGGSDYPRSELREMSPDGKTEAHWSSTKGIHTLYLDQAITSVPKKKPDVVAGQIHGDDDDVLVIRLESSALFVARGKKNVYTLDNSYVPGKRFTIKFVARDGQMLVYYNGGTTPVYILDKKLNVAYFKAGVYTQSNCETEGPDFCTDDNYGEVTVYQIAITHT